MKKMGRKARLTDEQRAQLQEDYARYERLTQQYQQQLKDCAPSVLARRYDIATSTVLDYARGRHKGSGNYGLTGTPAHGQGSRSLVAVSL